MNSIGESVRILVSMLYKRDGEHRIFFHDLLQGPFRLFLGIVGSVEECSPRPVSKSDLHREVQEAKKKEAKKEEKTAYPELPSKVEEDSADDEIIIKIIV